MSSPTDAAKASVIDFELREYMARSVLARLLTTQMDAVLHVVVRAWYEARGSSDEGLDDEVAVADRRPSSKDVAGAFELAKKNLFVSSGERSRSSSYEEKDGWVRAVTLSGFRKAGINDVFVEHPPEMGHNWCGQKTYWSRTGKYVLFYSGELLNTWAVDKADRFLRASKAADGGRLDGFVHGPENYDILSRPTLSGWREWDRKTKEWLDCPNAGVKARGRIRKIAADVDGNFSTPALLSPPFISPASSYLEARSTPMNLSPLAALGGGAGNLRFNIERMKQSSSAQGNG